MSYTHVIENVVKAVEAVGAGIMVLGGLGAFVAFLRDASGVATRDDRTSGCGATSAAASCSASRCSSSPT